MPDQVLYPIKEAEQLITRFIKGSLPAAAFSHEAHLLTGLYMLATHRDEALPRLRQHLIDFLQAAGVESTDTSGYHESITVFWLWALKKKFAAENGRVGWNQAMIDELLSDENLSDRNLWSKYYTKDRMMSVAARKAFVDPDLNPLD